MRLTGFLAGLVVSLSTSAFAQGNYVPGAESAPAAGPAGPQMNIGAPVAQPGWRFGAAFTPAFPMGDLGDGFGVGIGLRLHTGPEYMWGRIGVTPNAAFQILRFGGDEIDGSVLHFNVMPCAEAAIHLGMVAPLAGMCIGFEHYRAGGEFADYLDAYNQDTSGSGFGFEMLFGANIWFTPSTAARFAFQIHPGFTEIESASAGFFAINLGAVFAF